jgi:hypothetical protein
LRVDYQHVGTVRRLEQAYTLSRRALRKIERPQQTVLTFDEDQRLALIPDVIAGGDNVCAGIEKLIRDDFGDAEAAGCVLAVHHDEVSRVARAQFRQRIEHSQASGAADDVA